MLYYGMLWYDEWNSMRLNIVWDSNAMLKDFNDIILESVLWSGVCYRKYAWTDCIYYALNILYDPLSKYHFFKCCSEHYMM